MKGIASTKEENNSKSLQEHSKSSWFLLEVLYITFAIIATKNKKVFAYPAFGMEVR